MSSRNKMMRLDAELVDVRAAAEGMARRFRVRSKLCGVVAIIV